MGNYKFRLSDMMPNAWFYKLRDMSRTRNHNTSHPVKKKLPSATTTSSHKPAHCYYHTTDPTRTDKFYNSLSNPKASDTHFPDSPRKSSRRKSKRKTIYKPSPRLVTSSVSADCSCRATLNSVWTKTEPTQPEGYFFSSTDSSFEPVFHESPLSEFESNAIDGPESFDGLASWSSSCSCRVSSSTTDIITDMNEKSYSKKVEKVKGFDTISELELPPILTKLVKFKDGTKLRRSSSEFDQEIEAHGSLSIKIVKEDTSKNSQRETKASPRIRNSASYSTGMKVQVNYPRIASKKVQVCGRSVSSSKRSKSQPRRRFLESFAIVKSSFDPQSDFKESMVEMIVENNIQASKDLEELLACYLSLNSDKYHDLIVDAFQQIWFDMAELRM